MIERGNPHIYTLDGYLRCLSQLNGPRYAFGASSYEATSDIDALAVEFVEMWRRGDEYIPPREVVYAGREEIGYRQLMKEIAVFVFNGCLSNDVVTDSKALKKASEAVLWDIAEYFGLAATSVDSSDFNPLVTGPPGAPARSSARRQ